MPANAVDSPRIPPAATPDAPSIPRRQTRPCCLFFIPYLESRWALRRWPLHNFWPSTALRNRAVYLLVHTPSVQVLPTRVFPSNATRHSEDRGNRPSVPAVSSLPATSTRRRSRSALSLVAASAPGQVNMFGNLTFLRKWNISSFSHCLPPPTQYEARGQFPNLAHALKPQTALSMLPRRPWCYQRHQVMLD
jgi:hypothetical protein